MPAATASPATAPAAMETRFDMPGDSTGRRSGPAGPARRPPAVPRPYGPPTGTVDREGVGRQVTQGQGQEPHDDAGGARPVALIVDDEPDMRRFLSMSLEWEGFDPRTADSGPEALAWLGENRADVLVLDLLMPGMTGLEVASRVRQDGFSGPVIMFSAFMDTRIVQACQKLDIHPLSKVDTEALRRVARVLASELKGG